MLEQDPGEGLGLGETPCLASLQGQVVCQATEEVDAACAGAVIASGPPKLQASRAQGQFLLFRLGCHCLGDWAQTHFDAIPSKEPYQTPGCVGRALSKKMWPRAGHLAPQAFARTSMRAHQGGCPGQLDEGSSLGPHKPRSDRDYTGFATGLWEMESTSDSVIQQKVPK